MWLDPNRKLILASASPRRLALLQQISVPVQQLVLPVQGEDEPRLPDEPVTDYVMRTAHDKNRRAQAHWQAHHGDDQTPILSADTTVALGQDILGKPVDAEDAKRVLCALAGQTHDVYTAVVLNIAGQTSKVLSHTRVRMDAVLADSVDAYIASGEPFGKAGAYGIQGIAAVYVRSLQGSYSSVVGLPLYETAQLLRDAGLYR